jgi:2-polyprenyl-3-methyl-5-hydroxy-6-metoxy-1,4-benzoquinol methylase
MTSQETPVDCGLCGSTRFRVLYDAPASPAQNLREGSRITTDVYGAYGRIVRCRDCGLVFKNPRHSDADIVWAYQDMEDHDYTAEEDCRSMNAHLSLRVIKRHVQEGRLLDVGCATGIFLNAARSAFETKGVELSAWAADIAVGKLKLDVHRGSLDEAPFSPGHFDVVTMIDVVEHLADPKRTLNQIAGILRPGGLVYIVTPDIESLSARVLGRRWWGLRPAHLYYFSAKTLSRMLAETGFEVLEVRSFGRIFSYGYWLSRIRHYPKLLHKSVEVVVNACGVRDKVVYINTRDSIEVCAMKRRSASGS